MHMEPLVYVVDTDQAMIESLTWLIESINLKIKTYKCTQKFLTEYDKNQHSCLLLNVRMPLISGLQVQQRLNEQGENLPIIFISGYEDAPIVVQAMQNGAIDFLIKPFNDKALLDTVNKALIIDKNFRKREQEKGDYKKRMALLSQREIQVLQGILASEQNKIIASKLNISLKTVEAHRSSMMKKLHVSSVVDLIKLVITKQI